MRNPNTMILVVGGLLAAVASSANGDLSVGSDAFSNQGLALGSLGATTAIGAGGGPYTVSNSGTVFARPIVPFLRSDFAAVGGQGLASALLNFSVTFDTMEPGESASIDVLLFTTSETDLTQANRDTYAGLTGFGGAHTVIGSFLYSAGNSGPQSVSFNAGGLATLQSAISGTDATIGISFREFAAVGDSLDSIAFGIPTLPGMTIDVSPIPAPGAALLAMLGLPMVGWAKRRLS